MKKAVVILLVTIACFAMGCTSSREQLQPAGTAPTETAQEAAFSPAPDATEEIGSAEDPDGSGKITYISLDSISYDSAEELDADIDGVLLCRVTGESFRVYSGRDGSELPDPQDGSSVPLLNTVYSIEPIACFKGDYSGLTEIRIIGTHIDHDIEAQMAACGVTKEYMVPRFLGYQPDIEIGKLYVFAISETDGTPPKIHLRSQCVYAVEGDPEEIKSGRIMLKDLLNLYGEDAWNTVVSYCKP